MPARTAARRARSCGPAGSKATGGTSCTELDDCNLASWHRQRASKLKVGIGSARAIKTARRRRATARPAPSRLFTSRWRRRRPGPARSPSSWVRGPAPRAARCALGSCRLVGGGKAAAARRRGLGQGPALRQVGSSHGARLGRLPHAVRPLPLRRPALAAAGCPAFRPPCCSSARLASLRGPHTHAHGRHAAVLLASRALPRRCAAAQRP